jgi:hypothetical protein
LDTAPGRSETTLSAAQPDPPRSRATTTGNPHGVAAPFVGFALPAPARLPRVRNRPTAPSDDAGRRGGAGIGETVVLASVHRRGARRRSCSTQAAPSERSRKPGCPCGFRIYEPPPAAFSTALGSCPLLLQLHEAVKQQRSADASVGERLSHNATATGSAHNRQFERRRVTRSRGNRGHRPTNSASPGTALLLPAHRKLTPLGIVRQPRDRAALSLGLGARPSQRPYEQIRRCSY